jgi:hypothetical protein
MGLTDLNNNIWELAPLEKNRKENGQPFCVQFPSNSEI